MSKRRKIHSAWSGLLEADPWSRLQKAAFEWLKCWDFRRKDTPFENLPRDVALIIARMTHSGRIDLKRISVKNVVYSYYYRDDYLCLKMSKIYLPTGRKISTTRGFICQICLRPVAYTVLSSYKEATICPVHNIIEEYDEWQDEDVSRKCARCEKKISLPFEDQLFCGECFPSLSANEQRTEWFKMIDGKFEIEDIS